MTERLPHGYTNATRDDGASITKRYLGPDPVQRRDREVAALRGLVGRLPVPPVLAVTDGAVVLGRMPGTPGQEVLPGRPAAVLEGVGALARVIQQTPPELVTGLAREVVPGQGVAGQGAAGAGVTGEGVLVHGDFGPQNLLVDPGSGAVTAVLDWELVRRGTPVDDLAWAEWIVRTHHPDLVAHLPALFTGFGEEPPWSERQRAMLDGCARALAFVTRWSGPDSDAARMWRHRATVTAGFTG